MENPENRASDLGLQQPTITYTGVRMDPQPSINRIQDLRSVSVGTSSFSKMVTNAGKSNHIAQLQSASECEKRQW